MNLDDEPRDPPRSQRRLGTLENEILRAFDIDFQKIDHVHVEFTDDCIEGPHCHRGRGDPGG